MVLVVGNNVVVSHPPKNLTAFIEGSSRMIEDVQSFKDKGVRTIKEKEGVVYVHQHEFAVSHPNDEFVSLLGSEDATTCHIVVMRHPVSGATALAHFDGEDPVDEVHKTIDWLADKVFQQSRSLLGEEDTGKTLEVNLVGGYEDERGHSEVLSLALLRDLVHSSTNYILGLCCIGYLNTVYRPNCNVAFPSMYGCAVNVSTGDIFPARFDSHGPENTLRHVRCSFSVDNIRFPNEIYDCKTGTVTIKPFRFHSPEWVDLFLSSPPNIILQNMSTSPFVEPDYFVADIKAAMRMVRDFPDSMSTVFKDGAVIYKRHQRKWRRETEANLESPRS